MAPDIPLHLVGHLAPLDNPNTDRESPVFAGLQSHVAKTAGLTEWLRKALRPYSSQIKAAFVYGSVAKGSDTARSDIDLIVIGDELTYSDLYSVLQNAEGLLQRKVSPLFFSMRDWKRKTSQKDSFADRVKSQPKIFILGSEKDIG